MLTKYTDIVFDLGGVLLDIDRDRCVERLHGLGLEDAASILDLYCQSGDLLALEQGTLPAAGFFDALRGKAAPGVRDADIAGALNSFITGLPLARLQALRRLRSHGKRLYVLSNTNPIMYHGAIDHLFRQEGLSIRDYFDGEIVSFQEMVCKPQPAIFEILLRRYGIDAKKSLFIDDSQANCEAARRCGMDAVLLKPGTEFMDLLGI